MNRAADSKTFDKAFILAAGKGTRLRPHTDTMPKPMVPVAGRSIVSRTIEKLHDAGVKEIVLNLHYLGDVLEDHLKEIETPRLVFSREDELLDTGGGLKKAIRHFANNPYFIINGDALWDDSENGQGALARLAAFWNSETMDILLLLEPKDKMVLTAFSGDYHLAPDNHALRAGNKDGDYMFTGIRIVHPRIFDAAPDGAFSFLQLMDKAQQQGRLYGVAHDREWYHISTPEDLEAVDAAFRKAGK